MAWEKGKPRPKGAGRKKGTPNRKTQELQELLDSMGCDPREKLARIANGDEFLLKEYNKETGEVLTVPTYPTLNQIHSAATELMQYILPKRKAVEHSGNIDIGATLREKALERAYKRDTASNS